MSFTRILSPPADYKATRQLSLPNKSIDHPNPSFSTYSHSAGPQVAFPRRVSSSFNSAECDTVAKADAGVKEFVPAVRRGDVHAIISKIKDIITVQPDQTTVTTLDDVDLYSLPEVEQFLENSRVRFDYDSTLRSLTIVMAYSGHEFLSRFMRETFEPPMKELVSMYGGTWIYHSNCSYRPKEGVDDEAVPSLSTYVPDGWITDDTSGATSVLEISSTEHINHARNKLHKLFKDDSIIAGIILNLNEKYSAPVKDNDWDSHRKFVNLDRWFVGERVLGPIMFAGHCWGGEVEISIEIVWPCDDGRSTTSTMIPLVPRPSEAQLNDFNVELAELWRALVATHYRDQDIDVDLHSIPKLDITSFYLELKSSIYRNAHERYERVWRNANKRAKGQGRKIDERNQRFAAAAERRAKRQKFDHENEEDGEEVGRGQSLRSSRADTV